MTKPKKETTPCETSAEFDKFKELTSKLLKVKPEEIEQKDKKTTANKENKTATNRSTVN